MSKVPSTITFWILLHVFTAAEPKFLSFLNTTCETNKDLYKSYSETTERDLLVYISGFINFIEFKQTSSSIFFYKDLLEDFTANCHIDTNFISNSKDRVKMLNLEYDLILWSRSADTTENSHLGRILTRYRMEFDSKIPECYLQDQTLQIISSKDYFFGDKNFIPVRSTVLKKNYQLVSKSLSTYNDWDWKLSKGENSIKIHFYGSKDEYRTITTHFDKFKFYINCLINHLLRRSQDPAGCVMENLMNINLKNYPNSLLRSYATNLIGSNTLYPSIEFMLAERTNTSKLLTSTVFHRYPIIKEHNFQIESRSPSSTKSFENLIVLFRWVYYIVFLLAILTCTFSSLRQIVKNYKKRKLLSEIHELIYESYPDEKYRKTVDSDKPTQNHKILNQVCYDGRKFVGFDQSECIICLEEFKIKEYLIEFNCKHVFHIRCLKKWLISGNKILHIKCPTCKRRLF